MKNLILSILILFLYKFSFAQIGNLKTDPKYKDVKLGSSSSFELHRYYSSRDTSDDSISQHEYSITFRNAEFIKLYEYKTVRFNANWADLLKLYTLMNSVFIDPNKSNKDYSISFTLGEKDVLIKTENDWLGGNYGEFFGDNGFFYYNKRMLDKVFLFFIPPVKEN